MKGYLKFLQGLILVLAIFTTGGCLNKNSEISDNDILAEEGVPMQKSNVGYVDASRINLIYARTLQTTSGTKTTNYVEGFIEVEKPSYDRTVTLHYAMDNDLTKWYNDISSIKYYSESPNGAPGTREILYFKKQINKKITFALKYSRPANRDYWDNNNSKDYCLGFEYGVSNFAIGTYSVALEKFTAGKNQVKYQKTLFGSIILRNIAYDKDVKIVYSADNWKTSYSIKAVYAGPHFEDAERWNFDGYLGMNVSKIQFKVVYKVNGLEFVDNNFSKNYTATWN